MEAFLGILLFIGVFALNWFLKNIGISRIFRDYVVRGYHKQNGTYVNGYRRSWGKNKNDMAFFKRRFK